MKEHHIKSAAKNSLAGKEIILGICGGIAAYKTPYLVRKLKAMGAIVTCILTKNGAQFVTPLTLQTVSNNRVYEDMFDREVWDVEHVALARKADIIVIAPATADCISRLACGRADDLLSCVVLATIAPVLLCPAMNKNMWQHTATRENTQKLKKYGYSFLGPEKGHLACGEEGEGRLAECEDIVSETLRKIR